MNTVLNFFYGFVAGVLALAYGGTVPEGMIVALLGVILGTLLDIKNGRRM